MRFNKILMVTALIAVVNISCKDELLVRNPNEPTTESLSTESGIVAFTLGSIYKNGFVDLKYSDGVLGRFLGNGYHDLWADVVGAEAANVYMNQIGAPYSVFLDNNAEVPNPGSPRSQAELIKNNNVNSQAGNNPLFYDWAYMYAMNNACNIILNSVDDVVFSGDADTKKGVIKALAYWWKGYAYSRIGSVYIAGLIIDSPNSTNGNYKTSAEILAEAEVNFQNAEDILTTLSPTSDYYDFFARVLPDYFQTGKGNAPSPTEFIHSINTMRARNILANKSISAMTAGDWNQILTLTANGIDSDDNVFTVRANATGDIVSPNSGTIAVKSTGNPASEATYKISERLISDFRTGDKRKANNFSTVTTWIGESARGNSFNTRWQLDDGGNGMAGVIVYSTKTPGEQETYIAGTYEENQLMRAEANIYLNNVDAGLAFVDQVRTYQGAGLAATVGTGLTQAQAIAELRSERRVGLLFRYVAFYDARRWGILEPMSSGGGRTGVIVISNAGVVNTNAKIDYRFMDYFHVPDNELKYNPAAAGSAPVVNSKFP